MSSLTLAYITARKDCRIEWAFDAIAKQVRQPLHIIVVDRYAAAMARRDDIQAKFEHAFRSGNGSMLEKRFGCTIEHRLPKPSVWAGEYRLTKEDWFCAASVRNTALCLCVTSHIAYLDDLSCPLPGWLDAAYEAVAGGYISCGMYQKVRELVVEDGIAKSYVEDPTGIDNRSVLTDKQITECTGSWLYGASLVAPLEAFLTINGWPEDLCDSMGSEDYCCGIALQNAGFHLKYDKRLFTLESQELHFVEPPMKRSDFGVSPLDKSHAALNIALASKRFPNSFDLRELRLRVLAGEPFPIQRTPENEWFTGTPLGEL